MGNWYNQLRLYGNCVMHLALSWPNSSKVEARHRQNYYYPPATSPIRVLIPSYSSHVLRAVLAAVTMKPTPTLSRSLVRVTARPQLFQSIPRSRLITHISRPSAVTRPLTATRQFSQSPCSRKGLSPGSSDPPPPKTESSELDSHTAPVDFTDGQYHEIADDYLNTLLLALEEKAETSTEFEVEYSVLLLPRFTVTAANNHPGWCPNSYDPERNICHEQTTTQQTDLAVESYFRPEEVRLGYREQYSFSV